MSRVLAAVLVTAVAMSAFSAGYVDTDDAVLYAYEDAQDSWDSWKDKDYIDMTVSNNGWNRGIVPWSG